MLRKQLSARTDNCDVIGVIHPRGLFPFTARAACGRIEETADRRHALRMHINVAPAAKNKYKIEMLL